MRRDRRPYWVKLLADRLNAIYVNHFVRPALDGCGEGLRVYAPRHLHLSGPQIFVGDHVHFMALPDKPVRVSVFEELGRITIGDYSIVNPGVRITSASAIEIGHSCMLAMNAYLSDANWHDVHHRIFAPGDTAPITLGDNVWVGDNSLITKGVTVGENSIVGAWSTVTKDVPDNVIVAGNPAQTVKHLDTSHLTMRRDLFNGELSYDEFEARLFRERLAGNTLLGWLRSLIVPSARD